MNKESLKNILNYYKKGLITPNELVILIERELEQIETIVANKINK